MATNFPGANDTFNVPSVPLTTKLNSSGDSARTHTQSHGDLGDALMAMQAQQTYKAHTHDGVTFRYGNQLLQANTHQSADTDTATSAIHHTIGTGANQYASGTHTHPVVVTYPLGAFFFSTVSTYPGVTDPVSGNPGLGLIGTWTAVGDRFLCASGGGLGFAAGTTGGSNSHNHTIDATTNTQAAHSHSVSSTATGNAGSHSHNTNGTGSTTVGHFHTLYASGVTRTVYSGSGGAGQPLLSHGHTSINSFPSHSHSTPATGSVADHAHNLSSAALGNSSTHSHNNSASQVTNNLIPLFVVYMWKRTA